MKKFIGPTACLISGVGGTLLLLGAADSPPVCRVTDTTATQGCEVILPPCELEDSTGPCYWNAQERGNGLGRSFVAAPGIGVVPVV